MSLVESAKLRTLIMSEKPSASHPLGVERDGEVHEGDLGDDADEHRSGIDPHGGRATVEEVQEGPGRAGADPDGEQMPAGSVAGRRSRRAVAEAIPQAPRTPSRSDRCTGSRSRACQPA